MSDTKFTPGPWVAEGDAVHAMLENGAAIEIALVNPLGELRTEPEYANAHLIAAAPELYEALEAVESEMLIDGHLAEIVQSALAKARGEA